MAGEQLGGGWRARLRGSLPSLPRSRRDDAPRVAFTKEDARRLNARFAELDRGDRRAIVRAVNRGIPMAKRRDAELAIGVARRQQRFWSRAWLLGPAIAVVQVAATPIGWQEGLLLAAWGALLLGMMAAWWWTRARRAELENLKVTGARAGGPRPAAEGSADADEGHAAGEGGPAPRPPRPRGRKRR